MPTQHSNGNEDYRDREQVIALASAMEHLTNEVKGLRGDMHSFRLQMDGDSEKDGLKTRLALVEKAVAEYAESSKWVSRAVATEGLALVTGLIVWLMTHLIK